MCSSYSDLSLCILYFQAQCPRVICPSQEVQAATDTSSIRERDVTSPINNRDLDSSGGRGNLHISLPDKICWHFQFQNITPYSTFGQNNLPASIVLFCRIARISWLWWRSERFFPHRGADHQEQQLLQFQWGSGCGPGPEPRQQFGQQHWIPVLWH